MSGWSEKQELAILQCVEVVLGYGDKFFCVVNAELVRYKNTMNRKLQITLMLAISALIFGCTKKDQKPVAQKAKEPSPKPAWEHQSGEIKLNYPDEPAEALEDWWFGESVKTIEMEGPPLEFLLEADGVIVKKLPFDYIESETVKYKITVICGLSEQRLGTQVRIYAKYPSTLPEAAYQTTATRFTWKSSYTTDHFSSSPRYPAANMSKDEFTYLWIANTSVGDGEKKFIRLKVKPWEKE